MTEIPAPPPELAYYVGDRGDDPVESYLGASQVAGSHMHALLSEHMQLDGARVLDFGCGSGRLLRYMFDHADGATFDGCDIHAPSIEWLGRYIQPPHGVFMSSPEPPLPKPDAQYDALYATSVFTHLADSWARWLCEVHRLLKPGGIAVLTVINSGFASVFDEEPWDEERIGMLVLGPGNPWDAGGPMVLHSEWWIREHWGRAFEVLDFQHDNFGFPDKEHGTLDFATQGLVVLRKRDVAVTPQMLEEPNAEDPRELRAMEHGLRRAHAELVVLNEAHDRYSHAYHAEAERSAGLLRQLEDARPMLLVGRKLRGLVRRARTVVRSARS
jgi:SAM-dependent methyltransferase